MNILIIVLIMFSTLLIGCKSLIWKRHIYPKISVLPKHLRHGKTFGPILLRSLTTSVSKEKISTESVKQSRMKMKLPKISDISESEATVELIHLNTELEKHCTLYFEHDKPEISDAQYDNLVNRAEALVGKFKNLSILVPRLNMVGLGRSSKFPPYKHSMPMLSLTKAFNEQELNAFLDRVEKSINNDTSHHIPLTYIMEPKIDGLSLALIYELQQSNTGSDDKVPVASWRLCKAATRGDGSIGEDMTENVLKYMKAAVPQTLSTATVQEVLGLDYSNRSSNSSSPAASMQQIEIRGEVFMSKQSFEELNQRKAEIVDRSNTLLPLLSNARNAAAGALRRTKDSSSTEAALDATIGERGLQFYAYSAFINDKRSPFVESKNNNAESANPSPSSSSSTNPSPSSSSSNPNSSSSSPLTVLSTQSSTLRVLQKLGFSIAQPWYTSSSREDLLATCREWANTRYAWGYEADGAVVKVDAVEHQAVLGATSRAPRWAVAFKFLDEIVRTKLLKIEVQVGRTGVLTPVGNVSRRDDIQFTVHAVLEPIQLGGVLIERATLHNENEVRRLGVAVGDVVQIKRAGGVIPKIIAAEKQVTLDTAQTKQQGQEKISAVFEYPYQLPSACPECSSPTYREEDGAPAVLQSDWEEQDDGCGSTATVRCLNMQCPAQAMERISHYCSRDAANIDGLGAGRVQDLLQGGVITSILDLYKLRARDLQSIEATDTAEAVDIVADSEEKGSGESSSSLRQRKGWGDRSVNHLLAAIDHARHLPDHRFLYGLGVRHIGLESAKLLIEAFGGFQACWEYIRDEAQKLKESGLAFSEIPKVRTVRKKKASTNGSLDGDSSGVDEMSPVSGCASRLLAIKGVGPRAVESLLSYATAVETAELVEGLLQHVSFTSISNNNMIPSSTAAAQTEREVVGETTISTTTSTSPVRDTTAEGGLSAPTDLPLAGRVVVFTGKLESGMSRNDAEALCGLLGGTTRPSMNKSVNLLVQAGSNHSSKMSKAAVLGIEVWSEEQWSAFIKKHNVL